MRSGQEAARRFHEEPERSSDFLCLPDLEDLLFCLQKKKKIAKTPKRRDVLAARHRKVSALCCKTCPWNRASASKKGRAAEDLGVNALNSARDHRVPVLDFGRRLEAQHGGFASCQALGERDSLARPEPMPFERQSFEVEGQTTTVVSIEDRTLSMLVPLLQLSEVPRFPLTTRVSGGVGKRDDAIDVRSADAREVVEESIRLWMLPPSSDFGLPRG